MRPMHREMVAMRKRFRPPLLALALALALSGCKTTQNATTGTNITTGSISSADAEPAPSARKLLELQKAWKKRPGDARIGLPLACTLKALGQQENQLQVLRRVVESNPRRQDIRYHYGIELLKANRAVQAEEQFRRLLRAGRRDWQTFNALGSALAEQNRHAEARKYFRLALKLRPDSARILKNLATSHMMDGDPQTAERLLRQALSRARGRIKTKVRQNLALALGLQGRFKEARYMASHDLPPQQVEANMAYLRKMLGGGEAWDKLNNGAAPTEATRG